MNPPINSMSETVQMSFYYQVAGSGESQNCRLHTHLTLIKYEKPLVESHCAAFPFFLHVIYDCPSMRLSTVGMFLERGMKPDSPGPGIWGGFLPCGDLRRVFFALRLNRKHWQNC
ncbi:hypothetical protein TWF225_009494 [Orbilia oligospora]|uniref:Uncharacterized protein n=1 Tax=Orbilia oligospora TaxID=2813651 RepID=A0A7C8P4P1_ORBOL|nr:hypothetical protein TWF751_002551 [Orbilia oligospora]KAF3174412.1 hypothetical protein TWF225_009494 [Orbilia oligospora]KAF3247767.1 hypothetical protein TWF217_009564 [Orbilia oligospora]KAF3258793.1 hypothetical protein TWF128_004585 [Orbilia oligospora]KAF3292763.1 hypothetical protein TWF132_005461 [Orbilia oligospora]